MKYAFIQQQQSIYPVQVLCQALQVSRSGYYDWVRHTPSARQLANMALLEKIKAVHTKSKQRYGSPRVHAVLRRAGESAGLHRVARLMRAHDLKAQRSRRHRRTRMHRDPQLSTDNVLNRQFHAVAPNRKWVSDITFIPTRQGYVYLAMVLDLYSRAIVGWAMSHRINGQLVLDALTMAITQRGEPKRVLVHSDQGSQYTAFAYHRLLEQHDLISSMSRKGECHDNAVAESFFHTLKEELVTDADYKTKDEARRSIFEYIELFYNRKRLHSTLGYRAPLEYERMNAA